MDDNVSAVNDLEPIGCLKLVPDTRNQRGVRISVCYQLLLSVYAIHISGYNLFDGGASAGVRWS